MPEGNVPIKMREIVERSVLRVWGGDLGFGKYSMENK